MKTYKRNIGLNRGKARLWLEGKILADNGFTHGTQWDAAWINDPINPALDLVVGALGTRKVAGTAQRPIIDINSKQMLAGLSGEVTITVIQPGWLRVSPSNQGEAE